MWVEEEQALFLTRLAVDSTQKCNLYPSIWATMFKFVRGNLLFLCSKYLQRHVSWACLNSTYKGSYVLMDADYGRNLDATGQMRQDFQKSLHILATVMSVTVSPLSILQVWKWPGWESNLRPLAHRANWSTKAWLPACGLLYINIIKHVHTSWIVFPYLSDPYIV